MSVLTTARFAAFFVSIFATLSTGNETPLKVEVGQGLESCSHFTCGVRFRQKKTDQKLEIVSTRFKEVCFTFEDIESDDVSFLLTPKRATRSVIYASNSACHMNSETLPNSNSTSIGIERSPPLT